MIKRVVMMQFHQENLEAFFHIFENTKHKIRGFKGCSHLELWQDTHSPGRIFTYSYWESEDALNAYRFSDLFSTTWKKTKVLFSERPQAWSIKVLSVSEESNT